MKMHAWIQEFSSEGGGPGQSDKKSPENVLFLVLSLFDRSQMVNFKEIYHCSRFQRGSNIFQGGPTFSRGGGALSPPSGSALENVSHSVFRNQEIPKSQTTDQPMTA